MRYSKNKNIPKAVGPSGTEILTFSYRVQTTTLTTLEAAGGTLAKGATGVVTITLDKSYKMLTVGMSVQAATTAQLFIITTMSANSISVKQVTAGGGTGVEDIADATIDLVVVARVNT